MDSNFIVRQGIWSKEEGWRPHDAYAAATFAPEPRVSQILICLLLLPYGY